MFSCQGIMSGGGFDPVYGFIKRIESVALFVFCHAVDQRSVCLSGIHYTWRGTVSRISRRWC